MKLEIKDPKTQEVAGVLGVPELDLKALLAEDLKSILQDSSANAKLSESNGEVARLQEEVARLSSPEHAKEVLEEAAAGITRENWLRLGQTLGFIVTPEEQAALEEQPKVQQPIILEVEQDKGDGAG